MIIDINTKTDKEEERWYQRLPHKVRGMTLEKTLLLLASMQGQNT